MQTLVSYCNVNELPDELKQNMQVRRGGGLGSKRGGGASVAHIRRRLVGCGSV
jgi:hypothetical protein